MKEAYKLIMDTWT